MSPRLLDDALDTPNADASIGLPVPKPFAPEERKRVSATDLAIFMVVVIGVC
jgi:hypothetical protein